jgi:thiamine biosynthesis lipoprotein
MGSTCAVTVVGGSPDRLAELARRRVHGLEQRWSRFIASSEICALNSSDDEPRRVSQDTYLLVDHGVAAWRWTSGRFDPTVIDLMVEAGYDTSFEHIGRRAGPVPPTRSARAPGCGDVRLDPGGRTVTLPPGVGFDPGGLGKGLAADLVVEALLDAGAAGACVSMGGDLRVAGEPPEEGWRVGIANPFDPEDLIAMVALADHGLATSNRLIRRWQVDGEVRNHLLDPRSGQSVAGLVSASVIAGQAWWAEVLTKVAMVDRPTTRTMVPLLGGQGLYVEDDGGVEVSNGFAAFDARQLT